MAPAPEDPRPPQGAKPRKRGFWSADPDDIYEFRDSDIKERHGYYPLWLAVVAVVLVLWSVWYSYKNWGPPPP